jgi:hypothetical protein
MSEIIVFKAHRKVSTNIKDTVLSDEEIFKTIIHGMIDQIPFEQLTKVFKTKKWDPKNLYDPNKVCKLSPGEVMILEDLKANKQLIYEINIEI